MSALMPSLISIKLGSRPVSSLLKIWTGTQFQLRSPPVWSSLQVTVPVSITHLNWVKIKLADYMDQRPASRGLISVCHRQKFVCWVFQMLPHTSRLSCQSWTRMLKFWNHAISLSSSAWWFRKLPSLNYWFSNSFSNSNSNSYSQASKREIAPWEARVAKERCSGSNRTFWPS